jgi:hypothetical protein
MLVQLLWSRPGTVLIVLAHNKKAFTMQLFPRSLSREGAPSPSRGILGAVGELNAGPGQGGSGEWRGRSSGSVGARGG